MDTGRRHVGRGLRLALAVADLAVDGQGLLEAADRPLHALQPVGHPEVVQHPGLGRAVAGFPRALQADLVGGHPVRPVAAPVEEAHRGGRQPPGDVMPAAGCCLPGHRDHAGAFGLGPVQGLVQGGERQRPDPRIRLAHRHPGVIRGDDPGGGVHGMQIPGQDPVQGVAPDLHRLVCLAPFGCIDPDQVVKAVAVGGGRFEEMGIYQEFQRLRRAGLRPAQQRGGGGQRDGRPLPQAEQPECPAGSIPSGPEGPGRLAKLTAKQARTARSPAFSSSSSRCSLRSLPAIVRTVQPRRAASRRRRS